jgi:hypothetical protein
MLYREHLAMIGVRTRSVERVYKSYILLSVQVSLNALELILSNMCVIFLMWVNAKPFQQFEFNLWNRQNNKNMY